MDIVDLNDVINKYYKKEFLSRHTTYNINVSQIVSLNYNYINTKTHNVINKYKMVLNKKDIDVIIRCIRNDIKIKPIYYQMNYNQLINIIDSVIISNNKYFLANIHKNINISNIVSKMYVCSRIYNSIKSHNLNTVLVLVNVLCSIIKNHIVMDDENDYYYIYEYDVDDEDDYIDDDNDDISLRMLKYNNFMYSIKYLNHIESRLVKLLISSNNIKIVKKSLCLMQNIGVDSQIWCKYSCYYGYLPIIKFLHNKFKFTKSDYELHNNNIITWTVQNEYLDAIKFLHQIIGFKKENFLAVKDDILTNIYRNNSIDIIKYLHMHINFTVNNFTANSVYYFTDIDVVKYLHKEIGFTKWKWSLLFICLPTE